MLAITLPAARLFDERTEEFVSLPAVTLKLEHSLISISKWESKWHKSFLSAKEFTVEEFRDYVRCMSIGQEPGAEILVRINPKHIADIWAYIQDPMTATTITRRGKQRMAANQRITAETVYYWMVSFGIPFECEKWHLNRLLMLIQVCAIKQNPQKMNKREAAAMRAAANEANRKRFGSKG